MAKPVLTRCGYRCDLCLAYVENIEKEDQREILSEGWKKLYGFEIPPDQICCEGCLSCENPPNIIDRSCGVRACVIEKGIENCSQCDDFPCDILETRIVNYEDLKEKADFKITRTDRRNLIKPYENFERLSSRKEAFPDHSRMFNKNIVPDIIAMRKFIGSPEITEKWDELHSFIRGHYDFTSIIRFGGKDYGWVINYRKSSKSIINIHPERNSFTILLVYGKKELEKVEQMRDSLSTEMAVQIESAAQFHDGKWVWSQVLETTDMSDFKKLLMMKRKPEK